MTLQRHWSPLLAFVLLCMAATSAGTAQAATWSPDATAVSGSATNTTFVDALGRRTTCPTSTIDGVTGTRSSRLSVGLDFSILCGGSCRDWTSGAAKAPVTLNITSADFRGDGTAQFTLGRGECTVTGCNIRGPQIAGNAAFNAAAKTLAVTATFLCSSSANWRMTATYSMTPRSLTILLM